MRTTRSLSACLFVFGALAGCREPAAPKGPSKAQQAAAATDIAPPSVAPSAPRAQQAARISDLQAALTAAEACLRDGRVDRRCVAFRNLTRNLRAHKADATWQADLQAALAKPGVARQLALELYADAVIPPADLPSFITALMAIIDDPKATEQDRQHAVESLGPVENPAVADKALALLAADASPRVSAAAGYLLGKPAFAAAKAKSTVALMAALKGDRPAAVKRAAIQSLAKLEHAPAVDVLVTLLDDELVGANAVMALAAFEDPKAWQSIFARIERGAATGKVQPAVLAALIRLQSKPGYDAKKLSAALTALIKKLDETAATDRAAGMARDLARRHLARLQKAAAPTPAAKPAMPPPGK